MQALVGILLWDKQIKKIAKLNKKKTESKTIFLLSLWLLLSL